MEGGLFAGYCDSFTVVLQVRLLAFTRNKTPLGYFESYLTPVSGFLWPYCHSSFLKQVFGEGGEASVTDSPRKTGFSTHFAFRLQA